MRIINRFINTSVFYVEPEIYMGSIFYGTKERINVTYKK